MKAFLTVCAQRTDLLTKATGARPVALNFDYAVVILVKSIVPYTAVADPILFENLLEEKNDFEEEVCDSFFVAGAGAVLRRVGRCRIAYSFSATVAVSVVIFICMTERFELDSFNLIIAACAMNSFGCSALGTGRFFRFNIDYEIVTERWDFFLFNKDFTADGALIAFSQSGFGAGGGNGGKECFFMTECCNSYCLFISANGACPFLHTVVCTGWFKFNSILTVFMRMCC